MTTNEAIDRVSRLKPNAVQDSDIARWIMELNGRLIAELHMGDAEQTASWPEDADVPLAATGQWAELYIFYAVAMIEFYQREYANYNNSIIMFNDRVADFRRWYRRTNMPTGGGGWKNL